MRLLLVGALLGAGTAWALSCTVERTGTEVTLELVALEVEDNVEAEVDWPDAAVVFDGGFQGAGLSFWMEEE